MQHSSPTAASSFASPAADVAAMAPAVGGVEPAVTLDQVPSWSDPDQRLSSSSPTSAGSEAPASSFISFSDQLTGDEAAAGAGGRGASRFPIDRDINSKIYLWRGHPWNLEVDAVVNSTNENLDEAHCSPGLHAAAGPGLAEECATLGGCRTGMAKMTNAYDLPARKVIHTVGPKYAVKYSLGIKLFDILTLGTRIKESWCTENKKVRDRDRNVLGREKDALGSENDR